MSTNAHSDNLAESSDGFIIEVGSPANISFVIQNKITLYIIMGK